MSRVGKQIIPIPEKTEVVVANGRVSVKGPLGELSRSLHRAVDIKVADGQVSFVPKQKDVEGQALWGTYASHVSNMIEGVNKPFDKKLVLEGVGFKWDLQGNTIVMSLGFSHPIKVEVPEGLKVTVEKGNMTISGINKESVGQFTAYIRSLKKPEPYKGKGIHYDNEVVRRKEGKKST